MNGIEEPFYCIIALHDIKTKVKLTEDFTFELNRKELSELWYSAPNGVTSSKHAIFPLSNSHNRLATYLVIRIEKLYSGDIEREISKASKKSNVNFYFTLFAKNMY